MARIIVKLRDDYVRKNNTSAIFLQMFLMRQRITVNTGVHIPIDHWDAEKKQVKILNKQAREYNIIIDQAVGRASKILAKYKLMDRDLTPAIFRKEFENPAKYAEFYPWVKAEITSRDGVLTESTMVMHHSVIRSMEKFRKKLMFAEIDHKLIEKWEKWLKEKEGNSLGTISKKQRVLKTYLGRVHKTAQQTTLSRFRINRLKGVNLADICNLSRTP